MYSDPNMLRMDAQQPIGQSAATHKRRCLATRRVKKVRDLRKSDISEAQERPGRGNHFSGSGNFVDDEAVSFLADVDALDNFDFDSFLNTDDGGMGFGFPSSCDPE